jgi:membrane associated rhomboid family serine protease
MADRDRSYYRQVSFGPGSLSPVIRGLIIANVAIFLAQTALTVFSPAYGRWFIAHFGMMPSLFIFKLNLWQPFTYMFLHGGFSHILFNMFALWMFGTEVEQRMGSRLLAIYYGVCGVGAGLMTCLFWQNWGVPTIGASGAIFGVMIAFGLFFPDRIILLFFVIPIRAIYFAIGLGFFQVYSMITSAGGGISYIAHVGGMLVGYIFLHYAHQISGAVNNVSAKRREAQRRAELETLEKNQSRVDVILDKINKEGIHKLSRSERSFLREQARRRKG